MPEMRKTAGLLEIKFSLSSRTEFLFCSIGRLLLIELFTLRYLANAGFWYIWLPLLSNCKICIQQQYLLWFVKRNAQRKTIHSFYWTIVPVEVYWNIKHSNQHHFTHRTASILFRQISSLSHTDYSTVSDQIIHGAVQVSAFATMKRS